MPLESERGVKAVLGTQVIEFTRSSDFLRFDSAEITPFYANLRHLRDADGDSKCGTQNATNPPHPVLLPQWGRRCPKGG